MSDNIQSATNNPKWVMRWSVPSSSDPTKSYTVAKTETGEWGCSCPRWIFHRKVCKHIQKIAGGVKATQGQAVPTEQQTASLKELTSSAFIDL